MCKRALKSPAALQITVHQKAVKTQQAGGGADGLHSQKEGSKQKKAKTQTPCQDFGGPTNAHLVSCLSMTPEAGKLSTESVVVCWSPEINTLPVVGVAIWAEAAEQPAARIQIPPWLASSERDTTLQR